MEAPARPHRRLIWKYTLVVVTLVAAAIVSVGLTELYFSYQDSKRALTRVERDKASTAATFIEQLMQDLLQQLEVVARPTDGKGAAGLAERNQDFHRLLEREELVSQLRYLDAAGKEQVRSHPLELDRIGRGIDLAGGLAFIRARAEDRYLGPVYFQNGSQPHMTVSVAERAPGRGVVVADDRSGLRPPGHRSSADRNGGLLRVRRRLARRARSPIRTSTSCSGTRTSPRCPRYETRYARPRGRPPTR